MTREELLQLIAEVQRFQSELDDIEVKMAQDGTRGGRSSPLHKGPTGGYNYRVVY